MPRFANLIQVSVFWYTCLSVSVADSFGNGEDSDPPVLPCVPDYVQQFYSVFTRLGATVSKTNDKFGTNPVSTVLVTTSVLTTLAEEEVNSTVFKFSLPEPDLTVLAAGSVQLVLTPARLSHASVLKMSLLVNSKTRILASAVLGKNASHFFCFNVTDMVVNSSNGVEFHLQLMQDMLHLSEPSEDLKLKDYFHLSGVNKPFLAIRHRDIYVQFDPCSVHSSKDGVHRLQGSIALPWKRFRAKRNPFEVAMSVEEKANDRTRRASATSAQSHHRSHLVPCSRKEFLVTPQEIDLEHVSYPKYIDLGYCSGPCQYPLFSDRFNYTKHRFFLDRARVLKSAVDLPPDLPTSTCVPVSYKPVTVIVHSSSNGHISDGFSIVKYDQISVLHCGCI